MKGLVAGIWIMVAIFQMAIQLMQNDISWIVWLLLAMTLIIELIPTTNPQPAKERED